MELKVTGTNIELSDRVQSYIERKLGKLNRHWPNILEIRVEITEEKTRSADKRIFIHATVDANGTVFHGEERAEDQFQAIDRVAEVMISQLEHHKSKVYDKSRAVAFKEANNEDTTPTPAAKRVVKVKNFLIKPMSLQEAIDEMELLGHDFFLFISDDTQQVKLVYRRKDGNYGLIESRTK